MDRDAKVIRVGIIGFGTVGKGTVLALLKHRRDIRRRTGVKVVIKTIADKLIKVMDRGWLGDISNLVPNLVEDANSILVDPEIDIVVELIGGKTAAKEFVLKALKRGKAVVTANKALLASFWDEIMEAAHKGNTEIRYEGAVGGVIPIIAALQDSLVADKIVKIYGVLNGTTNFILTEMERTGKDFESLLKEAQKRGYAEANLESALSGEDAAYKIHILTLISGKRIKFEEINFEGIKRITPIDFQYAHKLGYTIKLVAVSDSSSGKIDIFVRPMLVPFDHPLATIQGSLNKIVIRGENSSETSYEGRGAGGLPTGIAVASNVVFLAKDLVSKDRRLSLPPPVLQILPQKNERERSFDWYLRFIVQEKPGIIHNLSGPLKDLGISIKAIYQEEVPKRFYKRLPFVMTLHETREAKVKRAVEMMKKFEFLVEPPLLMPFLA